MLLLLLCSQLSGWNGRAKSPVHFSHRGPQCARSQWQVLLPSPPSLPSPPLPQAAGRCSFPPLPVYRRVWSNFPLCLLHTRMTPDSRTQGSFLLHPLLVSGKNEARGSLQTLIFPGETLPGLMSNWLESPYFIFLIVFPEPPFLV